MGVMSVIERDWEAGIFMFLGYDVSWWDLPLRKEECFRNQSKFDFLNSRFTNKQTNTKTCYEFGHVISSVLLMLMFDGDGNFLLLLPMCSLLYIPTDAIVQNCF